MTVAKSKAVNVPAPFIWKPEMDGENRPDLEKLCHKGYTSDKLFQKILQNPKDHKSFSVEKGTIYHTRNQHQVILRVMPDLSGNEDEQQKATRPSTFITNPH